MSDLPRRRPGKNPLTSPSDRQRGKSISLFSDCGYGCATKFISWRRRIFGPRSLPGVSTTHGSPSLLGSCDIKSRASGMQFILILPIVRCLLARTNSSLCTPSSSQINTRLNIDRSSCHWSSKFLSFWSLQWARGTRSPHHNHPRTPRNGSSLGV